MIHELFDAATGLTVSEAVHPDRTRGMHREGIFQVVIADGATVELQGRCSADAPWHTVDSFTESDAVALVLLPFMRAAITSAGTVSAWLAE